MIGRVLIFIYLFAQQWQFIKKNCITNRTLQGAGQQDSVGTINSAFEIKDTKLKYTVSTMHMELRIEIYATYKSVRTKHRTEQTDRQTDGQTESNT